MIVREVNEVIRLRDLEESNKSMKFLKSKLGDTSETEIRFTINELIKTEIKTQTFANIKENYGNVSKVLNILKIVILNI